MKCVKCGNYDINTYRLCAKCTRLMENVVYHDYDDAFAAGRKLLGSNYGVICRDNGYQLIDAEEYRKCR